MHRQSALYLSRYGVESIPQINTFRYFVPKVLKVTQDVCLNDILEAIVLPWAQYCRLENKNE